MLNINVINNVNDIISDTPKISEKIIEISDIWCQLNEIKNELNNRAEKLSSKIIKGSQKKFNVYQQNPRLLNPSSIYVKKINSKNSKITSYKRPIEPNCQINEQFLKYMIDQACSSTTSNSASVALYQNLVEKLQKGDVSFLNQSTTSGSKESTMPEKSDKIISKRDLVEKWLGRNVCLKNKPHNQKNLRTNITLKPTSSMLPSALSMCNNHAQLLTNTEKQGGSGVEIIKSPPLSSSDESLVEFINSKLADSSQLKMYKDQDKGMFLKMRDETSLSSLVNKNDEKYQQEGENDEKSFKKLQYKSREKRLTPHSKSKVFEKDIDPSKFIITRSNIKVDQSCTSSSNRNSGSLSYSSSGDSLDTNKPSAFSTSSSKSSAILPDAVSLKDHQNQTKTVVIGTKRTDDEHVDQYYSAQSSSAAASSSSSLDLKKKEPTNNNRFSTIVSNQSKLPSLPYTDDTNQTVSRGKNLQFSRDNENKISLKKSTLPSDKSTISTSSSSPLTSSSNDDISTSLLEQLSVLSNVDSTVSDLLKDCILQNISHPPKHDNHFP